MTIQKKIMTVLLLSALAGAGGCAETEQEKTETKETRILEVQESKGSDVQEESFAGWFREPELVKPELLDYCEQYAALVEGCAEGVSFEAIEDGQGQKLEEMLLGHYEVAGRSAGEGRSYYLAVRRSDAPVYDDFNTLSVGSVDDVCQIGYDKAFGENVTEEVLYRISGWTVTVPDLEQKTMESPSSLDVFCFHPNEERDPGFDLAFTEGGRQQLRFIRKHKGLSFHEEKKPCIDFFYQDEDTVAFWSEPYPCCIPLEEEDIRSLLQLLENVPSENKREIFENYGEACAYLQKTDASLRTTGAGFCLGERNYQLLGNREKKGWLLSWMVTEEDSQADLRLEDNEEAWQYVTDRIHEVTGRDYGSFTDDWFAIPLTKASLRFPQRKEREDGSIQWETCVQTIEEPEKLATLSRLLEKAIRGPEVMSGCPYTGILDLTREDGEALQMFVAADSCDSITYEGRIGFEYGKQEELAEIFDEAMSAP